MIDQELLNILRCPETGQEVRYVEGGIIERINAAIRDGSLKNRGQQIVRDPIEAGLLRGDRQYIYPVRDGIPVMLIDEALPFAPFAG